jgi:hypothetical protein
MDDPYYGYKQKFFEKKKKKNQPGVGPSWQLPQRTNEKCQQL